MMTISDVGLEPAHRVHRVAYDMGGPKCVCLQWNGLVQRGGFYNGSTQACGSTGSAVLMVTQWQLRLLEQAFGQGTVD